MASATDKLQELMAAAQQAHEVLAARWFISTDDGDMDNDHEVIDADNRLTEALNAMKEKEE